MSWVDKFKNFINNINEAVNAFMGKKDPEALTIDGMDERPYGESEYGLEGRPYGGYGEYDRETDPYSNERRNSQVDNDRPHTEDDNEAKMKESEEEQKFAEQGDPSPDEPHY